MTNSLVVSFDGDIAEVRLNRPERKNALTLELFEALAQAGEELKAAGACARDPERSGR